MSKLDRRSVLTGALGGLSVGSAAGFLAAWLPARPTKIEIVAEVDEGAHLSYAQQGEDLVVMDILERRRVRQATYLDVGAYHPTIGSNTYNFYKAGGRGVLVEPNPAFADLLRTRRPRDTVLEVGIGPSGAAEADYYVVAGDNQLNTFSKEQAEGIKARHGPKAIAKVIKRALVPINDILAKHFAAAAPDFMSIDVEGLDLAILSSMDFGRFRPYVICVETSMQDGKVNQGILELLAAKDYDLRGGSFVNTVFVNRRA